MIFYYIKIFICMYVIQIIMIWISEDGNYLLSPCFRCIVSTIHMQHFTKHDSDHFNSWHFNLPKIAFYNRLKDIFDFEEQLKNKAMKTNKHHLLIQKDSKGSTIKLVKVIKHYCRVNIIIIHWHINSLKVFSTVTTSLYLILPYIFLLLRLWTT